MEKTIKYPIGQQSFEMLRNGGNLYVDKTRFIDRIINGSGQYFFLGRPRRFGKSLFLSTLKFFFLGRRDLFKGLYVDGIDWDWEPYPVLHLDLNLGKYKSIDELDSVVDNNLRQWESEYGVTDIAGNHPTRLNNIIRIASEKTGKGVVILVDEYDKPLVNNLHDSEMFEYYRNTLAALYSNFKSSADYIRLLFLTGVSRFGHLTIFSGLNNINDISFDDEYSDICGISQEELEEHFVQGLSLLAEKNKKTKEESALELKKRYDGYRFSGHGKDMYNPFSLLNVMDKLEFRNYWTQTGQATLLLEQLKKYDVDLQKLFNTECSLDKLQGLDLSNPQPVALLYQTGYLTIKGYDDGFYQLGIPNEEVKKGFLDYLMPYYANVQDADPLLFVRRFVRELNSGDVDGFMTRLTSLFAKVPYPMHMNREDNIHNALYMLILLLGIDVKTEYRTSNGRIDLFIATDRYYYIIEIKLDRPAQEALDQIKDKNYSLPFACDGREIVRIGVSFSSKDRTFSRWLIG